MADIINMNKNEVTGAQIVIKALIDQGVDEIFGYPGGAVLPFYDALFQQNRLRHILVRHEQGAAHAAEGYARSSGKVGVLVVTSGPGATNTVTGLTDAMMDSIPIVCITGQVPSHLIGSDAFQEADTTGITRACTKYNYLVKDVKDLSRVMHEAFHIARTGRPGPVVIDIPKDVFNQTTQYENKKSETRKSYKVQTSGDLKQVKKAVELISKAKKPVFYVGGGVINSGEKACRNLTNFVRKTGFPITNTLMGLGSYPGSDRQFLGMLGMHGSLEANMAMYECDVMINIGARFDDRVTGKLSEFSPYSKKIHVDIDPSSINKNVKADVAIIGDAGKIIEQLANEYKKQKVRPDEKSLGNWWKKIDSWRAKKSFSYKQGKDIIKPQYALEALGDYCQKQDIFITTDVGQHQMWAAQFLKYEKPSRWMTSGGLGTMGYGLPAAIGTQIANPKKPVICISGEASVMMNIQELSTVSQYRLPLKLFILNNQYMGMVRQWQEMFHGDRHSESYMESLPDFVELAKSFKIKGMRCTKVSDVKEMVKKMMEHNGPVVFDMVVDQKENVYPMIPAGAAHNEIVLGPDSRNDDKLDRNQV